MATRRQKIVLLLEQGPSTVKQIAEELGMRVTDVVDDLRHGQRA